MRPFQVVLIGAGTLVVALGVWYSIAGDVADLVDGAGWWSLAALGFPALVGVGAWRDW